MRILLSSRPAAIALISALAVGLVSSRAAAQTPAAPAPPVAPRTLAQVAPGPMVDSADAVRTRELFLSLLKQYPPSLGRVLKLDPSLFSNDAFLAPYPGLVQFLTQHPEVKRNPSFFLERIDVYGGGYTQSDSMRMWDSLIGGVGGMLIFVIVVSALGWTVRTIIDYRRWHRLSKTQSEAHTKLLDRFTANDELLAYVQSPAGSRFLQSAPISLDAGARALAAPFGRILWSVQAGLVAAAVGFGLLYVSGRVAEEVTQPLYTMGALAVSLGIGFVLSAVVSYVLSKRLGLFDPPAAVGPVDAPRRETHGG